MFSLRQILFICFANIVLLDSIWDTLLEWKSGNSLADMADDFAMLGLSTVVVAMLVREFWLRHHTEIELRAQLDSAWSRINEMNGGLQHGMGKQYRDLMQTQFDEWKLSVSEQDVVINLLKGLSFKEVASVRETKEKTVRQQAMSVYRKSGLSGRHELAAWFLEDLLDPQ